MMRLQIDISNIDYDDLKELATEVLPDSGFFKWIKKGVKIFGGEKALYLIYTLIKYRKKWCCGKIEDLLREKCGIRLSLDNFHIQRGDGLKLSVDIKRLN